MYEKNGAIAQVHSSVLKVIVSVKPDDRHPEARQNSQGGQNESVHTKTDLLQNIRLYHDSAS